MTETTQLPVVQTRSNGSAAEAKNGAEDIQDRLNGKRPRFPMPRYPTGWFQIGWSHELEVGEAKPVRYFGQDLVLFRTESGKVKLLDAFCPHLGAHLGHGGKIEGEDIKCPFHAWKFNGEGECTEIPYAKKVPPKAKMKCWYVVEKHGQLLAWHDIDKNPPTFEIPEQPEYASDEWTEPVTRIWRLRTHNQEMAENVVDTAHFKYLHGTVNQPEATIKIDGPVLNMKANTTMTTPGGQVEGFVEATSRGFGYSTNRFTGLVETLCIGNVAPVDDEYVDVRFTFMVKKIGGASLMRGVGKAFVAEVSRQLEQDAPVWENKVFFERPVLCDGDGPFMLLRKWGKQFYPEWYRKEAEDAYYAE
jgi:3-ketosteroid 9alpha-monooxygenase subunit A